MYAPEIKTAMSNSTGLLIIPRIFSRKYAIKNPNAAYANQSQKDSFIILIRD